jgi:hypothetical protein
MMRALLKPLIILPILTLALPVAASANTLSATESSIAGAKF